MTATLKDVLRSLETGEIAHAEYARHLSELKKRIDLSLQGHQAVIEIVMGPSRAGKTMLINALTRAYPETSVAGCRRLPVLPFVLPASVSPKEMPFSVLHALDVPFGPRSGGKVALFQRMVDQLNLAETRVLIGEEVSHSVDSGTTVHSRAAADWFKQVADRSFTLVLLGLPKLRRLGESNEQFRLRSSKPREFRPYDCRNAEELKQYAMCVQTFASVFKKAGYPVQVVFDTLVKHCYLLSGGLIGVTSAFFQRLAYEFLDIAPRPLTFADCKKASANFEPAGSPLFPAFEREDVTAPELAAAHSCVLEVSELSLRPLGAVA